MPVKISHLDNTIAGFDIVVALSEEAINAQFEKLYKTKREGRVIPPSILKSLKPAPPSSYLINHQLSLHLVNKKKSTASQTVYRDEGIDGFIECPRVRFGMPAYSKSDSAIDKYKKAYLEITFKRSDDGTKDSVMTYWDPDSHEKESVILNGYTMAWSVKIARRDVENVAQEIIQPAESAENPAATAFKVTKKLQPYVDSQAFQVSTIFCLFEQKSMADSFLLLDPERKPVYGTALQDARHLVALFFGELSDQWSENNNGTPIATSENPYILGYGISQRKLAVSDKSHLVNSVKTPEYFKPKQFILTTTPGEEGSDGWKTTSGSLNFCLLTHRNTAEGHDKVHIDEADLNAGIIKKNFFDLTKTMGRTADPHGGIKGFDGIMAFSKGVFSGLWLRDITQGLLVDPTKGPSLELLERVLHKEPGKLSVEIGELKNPGGYHRMTLDYQEKNPNISYDQAFNNVIKSFGPEVGELRGPVPYKNGYEVSRAFRTIPLSADYAKHGLGDVRQFAIGDNTVRVTYKSDTNSIDSVQDGLTHARRILLDIEFINTWDVVLQRKDAVWHALCSIETTNHWIKDRIRGFDAADYCATSRLSGYLNVCAFSVRMASLVRVEMRSGQLGTWIVSPDEANSKNMMQDQWGFGSVSADSTDFGNSSNLQFFNDYTSESGANANFHREVFNGFNEPTKVYLRDMVEAAFGNLTTTIIMPAGEVFNFGGLDSDEAGNVYAQLSFAQDGGFKVVEESQKT